MAQTILSRMLLISIGIVIALGGGEIAVRNFRLAPEVALVTKGRYRLSRNEKIGYEPIPGLNHQGNDLFYFDYRGEANDLGYRDRKHSVAKPSGVYRIAVLGDSIAAGLWIERSEDLFPVLMEERLRAGGIAAEVMNYGVIGYNTQQEIETLIDKGLVFSPDLVLLAYCLNDRERQDGTLFGALLSAEQQEEKLSSVRLAPLFMTSALFRFLRYRVFSEENLVKYREEYERHLQAVSGDTVDQYLGVLAKISAERHFKVLIALFPDFSDLESYRLLGEHQHIEKVVRDGGMHFVDLLEPFRECRKRGIQPLNLDQYHPTPLGNQCAAEAMADKIRSMVRTPALAE